MKNDFRGRLEGQPVKISVPPTLLITAVGRVPDIKKTRTADFKAVGDLIYLLGPAQLRLLGSELADWNAKVSEFGDLKVGLPDWDIARLLYSWLGGATGKLQTRLKSLHDVSEGGLLVAVAEGLLSRGFGASLVFSSKTSLWEQAFGEGFHTFVASISPDDQAVVEEEWKDLKIPFRCLGQVESRDRLEIFMQDLTQNVGRPQGGRSMLNVGIQQLRSAWQKEGYWE
jgi:phosphoribosylformylglycinamidine synthase subunit PurSL